MKKVVLTLNRLNRSFFHWTWRTCARLADLKMQHPLRGPCKENEGLGRTHPHIRTLPLNDKPEWSIVLQIREHTRTRSRYLTPQERR